MAQLFQMEKSQVRTPTIEHTKSFEKIRPQHTSITTTHCSPTRVLRRQHFHSIKMSDNGEIEVEAVSGYQVLPKEVLAEIGSIKLFNRWSYEDVEIRDISLT